jgi:hypothetical protein
MTAEQQRVEFLKGPENVALACEIISLFPKVELELTKKFWNEVHSQVDARTPNAAGWQCTRFPSALAHGFGVAVRPIQFTDAQVPGRDDHRMFVQVTLEQEGYLSGLFYGVCFNRRITSSEKSLVSQMLKPLQDQLDRLKYRKAGDWNFTYIGWKYIEAKGPARSELLKAVASDETAEGEVSEEVIGCFNETQQLMEALNLELARIR